MLVLLMYKSFIHPNYSPIYGDMTPRIYTVFSLGFHIVLYI